MYKAYYVNLGTNIFGQKGADYPTDPEDLIYREKMYFDESVWDKILSSLTQFNIDTLVIGLAEGMRYNSHPELAIDGSFSTDWLKNQIKKLKAMGVTAVPCLDLLPPRNAWLQAKGYFPGTEKYSVLCRDLINEVIDIFDTPELFNVGIGNAFYDSKYIWESAQPITVICQPWVLSNYVKLFFDTLRARGVRPWMWVDTKTVDAFGGEKRFKDAVSKDVVITCCYNCGIPIKILIDHDGKLFAPPADKPDALIYKQLSDWGYEQIVGVTRRLHPRVPKRVMEYCSLECDNISGYIMFPEINVVERKYYSLMNSLQNFDFSYNAVFGKGGTLNG